MRIYIRNKFNLCARNDPCDRRPFDVEDLETIGSLKSKIMEEFCLTGDEIERRLLVPDGRKWRYPDPPSNFFSEDRDLLDLDNGSFTLVDGRDLFDQESSATIGSCGVKDEATLVLGLKGPFLIYVGLSFYTYESIEVSCDETVSDLKLKIQQRTGKDNFPWIFNSVENADDRTLLFFGFYNRNYQHKLFLNRDNTPFLDPFWDPIVDEEDDPSSTEMQIGVKFPNVPWRLPLNHEPNDTIKSLRRSIQGYSHKCGGISTRMCTKQEKYTLFFKGNQLEDKSGTLDDCGIKNMDSVQLFDDATFPIAIFEPENGRLTITSVKCFYTIGKLKETIQHLTNILKEEQHLVHKEWFLDDDRRRLVDYGIEKPVVRHDKAVNGSLWSRYKEKLIAYLLASHYGGVHEKQHGAAKSGLFLNSFMRLDLYHGRLSHDGHSSTAKFQIVVEVPNMPWRFPLDVGLTDTIGTVNEAIIRKYYLHAELYGQKYIEKGMFVLLLDKGQLNVESITLAECGIGHMDSVQLFEKTSLLVEVEAPVLEIATSLEVSIFDTIGKLKEKLELVTQIPKAEQRVSYVLDQFMCSLFLDDEERRLVDYGIMKQVEYDRSLVFENSKNRRFWDHSKYTHWIRVAKSKAGLEIRESL